MSSEFSISKKAKNKQALGKALLDHLGGEVLESTIAALTDTAPDEIREAIADALHRGETIHRLHVDEASREENPGYCANLVCKDWVQSEGEEEVPHSSGAAEIREACDCLFRMKEPPPNHLDGVTCQPIPEWSEAINMLRRAGLLEPDEWGRYNGTDFALQPNISKLWWTLVDLLVETGKIDKSWVDQDIRDRGAESRQAKQLLFQECL